MRVEAGNVAHALQRMRDRTKEDAEREDLALQNWKPIHDKIVALALAGYSNNSIAAIVGYSHVRVCQILKDPRAEAAIKALQSRMFDKFHERIEGKLLMLGERAVENIGVTINAEIAPATKAKRHQDNVSFKLLDTLGYGSKQDLNRGNDGGIQLTPEASDRIATAIEKANEAQRIIEQAEEVEIVEEA